HQCFWTYVNGKLTMIPRTIVGNGQVVKLNAHSGMVGQPEQTELGLRVVSLLNPQIVMGTQIQINNADITTPAGQLGATTVYDSFDLLAIPDTSADGMYIAYAVDHHGDTRGNE